MWELIYVHSSRPRIRGYHSERKRSHRRILENAPGKGLNYKTARSYRQRKMARFYEIKASIYANERIGMFGLSRRSSIARREPSPEPVPNRIYEKRNYLRRLSSQ